MDTAAIDDRLSSIRANVAYLQSMRPTPGMTKAQILARIDTLWNRDIGPFDDLAREAWELLHAPDPDADPPPDEPEPTPPPQFVAPVPEGAVYGQTKWYQGPDSTYGCDLFCAHGTPVYAPCDAVVEEVLGGTGLQGGAEIILAAPANRWAFRYRHVQAMVQVGQQVAQGEQVGVVQDQGLLLLGNPPAWAEPLPDGYQHLDLSVNQGTDRFTPTGGAGGNTSAYAWLVWIGYRGRVLARTPGPPDAGH